MSDTEGNIPSTPVLNSSDIAFSDNALQEIAEEDNGYTLLHFSKTVLEILLHTIALVLSLGSIWLVHFVLERLLGKEFRFFDFIPIRYIMDIGEIVVIGKFLWEVIKGFARKGRK
jgi:hypothetical protein